jgi:hypothetical protein
MQYISPLSLRNISASDMNRRERYKLWITECERLGLKKSVRALKKKLVKSLAQFELLTCNVKRIRQIKRSSKVSQAAAR